MHYVIRTDCTSKSIGSKGNYQSFDSVESKFDTLDEVKNYLQETYKDCKKIKMYIDTKTEEHKHTGWIYCFKNKDWSHDSKTWLQQDWVQIYEVETKNIIV